MHGRWRWCRAAVLAMLLAGGPIARGQLLRLEGDVAPPPAGSGADALALASAVDASIAGVRARGDGPGIDAAIGLRRLARDLLRAGEKAGAAGSARVLAGRTIAYSMPALDGVLLKGVMDPAEQEVVAATLAEGSETVARLIAADAQTLDRLLRDVMAPIMQASGAPRGAWGWVTDPPEPEPQPSPPLTRDLQGWEPIEGVTGEALEALKTLEQTLTEADGWIAYRRAAAVVRAEVRAAGAALGIAGAMEWITPEARAQLGADFSSACIALGAGPSMAGPRSELRRLARVGRVLGVVDALGDEPRGRRVRTALVEFLRNRSPDHEAEGRTLDSFERTVAGIAAGAGLGESRALVRHLRPAWRVLDRDRQAAERALIEVLPSLLQFESALTEPGVLSAIAAHRRSLDDLRSLFRVSAALATPRNIVPGSPLPSGTEAPGSNQPGLARDAEPAAGWKPIADRLLKIAQDLGKSESHDAAAEQFRAFASRLERFAMLPGEADLRAGGQSGVVRSPGWDGVTGGRAAELPASIGAAREAWLDAFVKTGSATESSRLELLERLMAQLFAAGAVQALVESSGGDAGRGPGALSAWPGWELSGRAMSAVLIPAREGLAGATAQVLTGAEKEAAESLATNRRDHAAVLLIGTLERRARELGLESGDGPGAAAELGCGAPLTEGAWMAPHREALAHICRYLEEFASPGRTSSPSDPAATTEEIKRAFLAFAASRARRVLDEVERAGP